MIREMLESLGQKCGLIGTIGHHLGNEVVTSQNTTRMPLPFSRILLKW